jgi:hypothetical protein
MSTGLVCEFFQERGLPLELCGLIMEFASPWKNRWRDVMGELVSDSIPDVGVDGTLGSQVYDTACNRCLYFSAAACGMHHNGRVSSVSYQLHFRRRKMELLAEPREACDSLRRLMDCDVWPVLYPKRWFDILCPSRGVLLSLVWKFFSIKR